MVSLWNVRETDLFMNGTSNRVRKLSTRRPVTSPWSIAIRLESELSPRSYRFILDSGGSLRRGGKGIDSTGRLWFFSRFKSDIRVDRTAAWLRAVKLIARQRYRIYLLLLLLLPRMAKNSGRSERIERDDRQSEVFLRTWLISVLFVRAFVYATIQNLSFARLFQISASEAISGEYLDKRSFDCWLLKVLFIDTGTVKVRSKYENLCQGNEGGLGKLYDVKWRSFHELSFVRISFNFYENVWEVESCLF